MYRASALIALLALLSLEPAARAGTAWTIGTTSTGWSFVPPTTGPQSGLPAMCKAASVSPTLEYGFSISAATTKYGSLTNWATAFSNRMKSWGFNAGGGEDFSYDNNFPTGGVPAAIYDQVGFHAVKNNQASYAIGGNVKVVYDTDAGPICTSFGGTAETPDFWDSGATCTTANCENAMQFYADCMTNAGCSSIASVPVGVGYLAMVDENDMLYGFNKEVIYHQDEGYFLIAQPPMFPDNSGVPEPVAGAHTYVDKTFYGKFRAADLLVTAKECSGNGTTWSGTAAACCTGVGTGTCSAFPNASFHSGSNPFGDTYIGATPAADGLSNATHGLNATWGLTGSAPCTATPTTMCNSGYTTWSTTDAGGTAGIYSGTYASHGIGTGFLDENGKRTGPTSGNCFKLVSTAWSNVPQIQTDAENLLVADQASRYIAVVENALNSMIARPPWAVPLYHPPSYVLTAMASELASDPNGAFWFSPGFITNGSGAYDATLAHTQAQGWVNAIEASGHEVPFQVGEFFQGNDGTGSDAAGIGTQSCIGTENVCFHQQNTRAAGILTYWQMLLSLQFPNGKYPVIGLEHDYMYDAPSQTAAFGLASSEDNGYDGAASSAVSNATAQTACTNTTYTAPAECKDTTDSLIYGFYGSAGAGTTCNTSSAGAIPTGGAATVSWGTDSGSGSCVWISEGSSAYTKTAETGTFGGANPGGGAIIPIRNFLTGATAWTDGNGVNRTGFCDPASTPSSGIGGSTNVEGLGLW